MAIGCTAQKKSPLLTAWTFQNNEHKPENTFVNQFLKNVRFCTWNDVVHCRPPFAATTWAPNSDYCTN